MLAHHVSAGNVCDLTCAFDLFQDVAMFVEFCFVSEFLHLDLQLELLGQFHRVRSSLGVFSFLSSLWHFVDGYLATVMYFELPLVVLEILAVLVPACKARGLEAEASFLRDCRWYCVSTMSSLSIIWSGIVVNINVVPKVALRTGLAVCHAVVHPFIILLPGLLVTIVVPHRHLGIRCFIHSFLRLILLFSHALDRGQRGNLGHRCSSLRLCRSSLRNLPLDLVIPGFRIVIDRCLNSINVLLHFPEIFVVSNFT